MAMTVADLWLQPGLLDTVRAEFERKTTERGPTD
jgi:hypothetical protein